MIRIYNKHILNLTENNKIKIPGWQEATSRLFRSLYEDVNSGLRNESN